MVRLEIWIQDTLESGHWELTGLMTRKMAQTLIDSNCYERARIVEDSGEEEHHEHKFKIVDGLPICDCGKLCSPPKTKADRNMKG